MATLVKSWHFLGDSVTKAAVWVGKKLTTLSLGCSKARVQKVRGAARTDQMGWCACGKKYTQLFPPKGKCKQPTRSQLGRVAVAQGTPARWPPGWRGAGVPGCLGSFAVEPCKVLKGMRRWEKTKKHPDPMADLPKPFCRDPGVVVSRNVQQSARVAAALQQLSHPPPPSLPAAGLLSSLIRGFAEEIPSKVEEIFALCFFS